MVNYNTRFPLGLHFELPAILNGMLTWLLPFHFLHVGYLEFLLSKYLFINFFIDKLHFPTVKVFQGQELCHFVYYGFSVPRTNHGTKYTENEYFLLVA